MRSDDIEKALQELLGASAGPCGIVVTLRRHDEYELLMERIKALEVENEKLYGQIMQMRVYPELMLTAMDELRHARKLLDKLGVDTSFISSLKAR